MIGSNVRPVEFIIWENVVQIARQEIKMTLEDELMKCKERLKITKEEQRKILEALNLLYTENYDINDEPQIIHLNKAITHLNLSINGGEQRNKR